MESHRDPMPHITLLINIIRIGFCRSRPCSLQDHVHKQSLHEDSYPCLRNRHRDRGSA